MQRLHCGACRLLLIAASLMVVWQSPAICEGNSSDKTEDKVFSESDLSREEALGAKVSFEVKGRPLSDLLRDIQKLSGVAFMSQAGKTLEAKRVTARAKDMSLASVLSSLSRLYGVRWSKATGGYTMLASDRSEVDLRLMQRGQMFRFWEQWAHYPNFPKHLPAPPPAINWSQELVPYLDVATARTGGTPVTDLPADVQQKLRTYLPDRLALRATGQNYAARSADVETFLLRIAPPVTDGNTPPDRKHYVVSVLNSRRDLIMEIPLFVDADLEAQSAVTEKVTSER
jgi:hypothetical protein